MTNGGRWIGTYSTCISVASDCETSGMVVGKDWVKGAVTGPKGKDFFKLPLRDLFLPLCRRRGDTREDGLRWEESAQRTDKNELYRQGSSEKAFGRNFL